MRHNTTGTYEGTADLVEILIAESKYAFGWRPARAGMLYALRDSLDADGDDETIYMTPERFTAWIAEAKLLSKARGDGMRPAEVLGLSQAQIRAMASGNGDKAPTGVRSRPVALACAHYTMGLEMPVEPLNARALDDWYRPRFGGTERVVSWMRVHPRTLSDRLRGYAQTGNTRVDRLPEAHWVRALDWLYTVGPICPFGPKAPVDIWPGQSEGLNR